MGTTTSSKKYSAWALIILLLGLAALRSLFDASEEVIEASTTSNIPLSISKKEMAAKVPAKISDEDVSATLIAIDVPTSTTLPNIPEEVQKLRREAMASLKEMYVAEKAYHAEYNRYTTDMMSVTYLPSAREMKFRMGFVDESRINGAFDPTAAAEDPRRKDLDVFLDLNQYGTNEQFHYSKSLENHQLNNYRHLCQNGCTADQESFEVLLVMPLGEERGVDVWSIQQDKTITLLQDGIK